MHAEPQELISSNEVPGLLEIPDKLYFKIGEVSAITGVEPHVLRYWESEIKVIRPQRASSKQRLYRRIDIENIIIIKKLIQEDGFTIPGARKFLAARKIQYRAGRDLPHTPPKKNEASMQDFCREMKSGLKEIKKLLES